MLIQPGKIVTVVSYVMKGTMVVVMYYTLVTFVHMTVSTVM